MRWSILLMNRKILKVLFNLLLIVTLHSVTNAQSQTSLRFKKKLLSQGLLIRARIPLSGLTVVLSRGDRRSKGEVLAELTSTKDTFVDSNVTAGAKYIYYLYSKNGENNIKNYFKSVRIRRSWKKTNPPLVTPVATIGSIPTPIENNFPKGLKGIDTPSIVDGPNTDRGKSKDTFRHRSNFTHINGDDPIRFPRKPGASPLVMHLGNSMIDAFTTPQNIRTRCRSASSGGTANCTGYWMPAFVDGSGKPVPIDWTVHTISYYKTDYNIPDSVIQKQVPFPPGLAMMAGDPTIGRQNNNNLKFSCNYGPETSEIPSCPKGGTLLTSVFFPRCWNGKDLDSPNHKSHMAYASNGCPSSHPVIFPQFKLRVIMDNIQQDTNGWRLSSDTNKSLPPGYSLYSVWMNGWDQDVMQTWIKNCNHVPIDCIVDMLNNGKVLGAAHLRAGN
jgi:hypothetical protein